MSGLLAKTLRSSTLKLALICIVIFGAVVVALLGYVYWSTTSYVRGLSDHAITAELAVLQKAYASTGRSGLITTIEQHIADQRFEGSVYLLTDASFAPLAGNLKAWPAAMKGSGEWATFNAPKARPDTADQPLLRATFETLPDGTHLLVGAEIGNLDEFVRKIKTALAPRYRVNIRACRGGQCFRHTAHGGADRSHQRDEPSHHAKRPRPANTLAGNPRRMG